MWTEPILHVDMDSFYVEVERLGDPSLRGRPVAVGGSSHRGVIASASYQAREFGVHSAQPTGIARRLCPDLIVVTPDHHAYGEMSGRVFEIFREYTPLVEGISLDEAFLDVRGLRRHFSSPVVVAIEIRRAIRQRLGLPASVGVAASKFVAKLASESAKPDGLRHVPVDSQLEYLHALPARSLWGVGPATLAGLERLGVKTVGDLAELPRPTLVAAFGTAHGSHLSDLANGIDPRSVDPDTTAKSVSVEQTFEQDLNGRPVVETALLSIAHRLSDRLRRSGLTPRTISLKVRYQDFTTVTRSVTIEKATSSRELYRVGLDLLGQLDVRTPIRLLGLGGANFEESETSRGQLSLGMEEEQERLAKAVAGVRDKFGDHAVEPARLLQEPDPPFDGGTPSVDR